MIETLTADIFSSPAKCLVNTVNCEGFMGKGLAYRFRQHYPLNYEHYVAACQTGQVRIGHILFFDEAAKTIANFPTKDKWRDGSRYEYIEAGLVDLKIQLTSRAIASIAIPPLGCGNGGLEWHRVRPLIEKHLATLDAHVYLHTPLKDTPRAKANPRYDLGLPHLVLLILKDKLCPFSTARLKSAALLSHLICARRLFDFEATSTQEFVRQIDTLCGQIKAFKRGFGVDSLQAKEILHGRLTSSSIEAALSKTNDAIEKAAHLVNSLASEHDLDVAAAVLCALKGRADSSADEIARLICPRFAQDEVCAMIGCLEGAGILERTLLGFRVVSA